MMISTRWAAVGVVAILAAAVPGLAAAGEVGGSTPLADDPTLIALAVALSCAEAPLALEAPPSAEPGVTAEGPELELVATVRAKALRFDEVPKVDVLFRGNGKRKTVWKTERVNLPLRPQPGVTYRDVQVRLTVTSDLEELTSMLREAKRASGGVRIEQEVVPAAASAAPTAAPAAAPVAPAALPPVEIAPPAPPAPPQAPEAPSR